MKKTFLIFMLLCSVAGCSDKVKKKLGFIPSTPDEFMVAVYPELKIPEKFELPAPKEELGKTHKAPQGSDDLSQGESSLLERMEVGKSKKDIRRQIDKEAGDSPKKKTLMEYMFK
jgi:hypothetical protein